jgi:tetratricopeptide (TPR) repeat protein
MSPAQVIAEAAQRLLSGNEVSEREKHPLLLVLTRMALGLQAREQARQLATALRESTRSQFAPQSVEQRTADMLYADSLLAFELYSETVAVLSPIAELPELKTSVDAMSLWRLANALSLMGNDADLERSRALMIRFGAEIPKLSLSTEERFSLYQAEATYWTGLRDFKQGMPLAQAAIAYHQQHALKASEELLLLYASVAAGYAAAGDFKSASKAYLDAIALGEKMYVGPNHPTNNLRALLGSMSVVTNELDRAEPLIIDALRFREQNLGTQHFLTLQSMNALARLRLAQKRETEAYDTLYRVIAACEKRATPNTLCVRAMINLGRSLTQKNELDEAERLFQTALALQESLSGKDSGPMIEALLYWTELRVRKREFAGVRDTVTRIEAIARKTGGYQAEVLLARARRAEAYLSLGDAQSCLQELSEVEPVYSKTVPNAVGPRVSMLRTRAQCAAQLKQFDQAKGFAESALALAGTSLSPSTRAELEALADKQPETSKPSRNKQQHQR